jgi:hypothetical protein
VLGDFVMHGAFRRGLFASAFLGTSAFLAAVACSTEPQVDAGGQPLAGAPKSADLAKPARAELGSLIGRATVPFTSNGRALVPVPRDAVADATPSLGMRLPISAGGQLLLHPAGKPERSLALTPVAANETRATLARDGSAVYERAFGSADLVQSATLEGLRTQIAIHDAASPALFVWSAKLAEGLRAQARDDLGTDIVDADGGIWLAVSPVTLTDARGAAVNLPIHFDSDGFARLRVEHRDLAYPALVDFGVSLGSVQALAIAPTLIKGRVMVLLDTSGSMIWQFGSSTGTGGDSPRDGRALRCDNNMVNGSTFACTQNVACTAANGALPYWPVADANQPSRMLASKLALQNVVNANAGLLDFGLERYAQDGACANATYCCNTQINGTTRGVCQDVGEYTDVPNTGTGNDLSYSGSCGTATVGGRVLVQPGPTSGTQLLPWVDFVEDFCSSNGVVGGPPRNPELRGDGSTPLARSIITAREDWYRPVYTASKNATPNEALDDTLIDCRPYVLVVMTDGDDTCSIAPVECAGTDATCGAGKKCVDFDTDPNDETWLCPCATQADCNGANQDCILGTGTQDCNDTDAQCASNDCVNVPGNGDNWRCTCASNADCGVGMVCNTAGAPAVDCDNDDSRCISNDCFDPPQGGTNYRCACNGNAQCPATQQCTGGVCVARGVCQGAGRCDAYFEPRPRAQVQALTDVSATNPVKTYVLGMGNPAALNQTELNAMAVAGGTTQARFASSQAEIEAAFADIVANTVKYEVCNTADDNCNSRIDEGLGVYQECLTAADCAAGASCNAGRCACTAQAQCGAGYTCSAEAPTRFCRPSCSEGQGACFVAGVRKCGVGPGQCCVDNNSATCTDVVPPAGTAEVCNGIDDNCNGFIDENLPCQGCVPLPEVCDGKDNDCDGLSDELDNPNTPGNDGLVDVGGSCGSSVGLCTPGTAVCTNGVLDCSGDTGPFAEVCNGYDDDCDGVVDGMSRACYTGMPPNTEDVGPCHGGTQRCQAVVGSGTATWEAVCQGQVVPTTEICNGVDDDCDGTVDDGIMGPNGEVLGAECCGKGVDQSKCGKGQCEQGTYQCAGNVLVCANAGLPSNELCDNVDNDCNGAVDDITNIGGNCEAPGGCSGKLQCDSKQEMLVCVPDGATGVEVCNGLDDDCDGKTDEIEDISVNDDWWHDPCNVPPPGHDQPPCGPGQLVCKNGEQACEGGTLPLDREVCDLKDNDCDGIGDTLAACPGANACVQGVCVEPCHGGEFPCPGGYECETYDGKNYCVPTTCNDVECPPGASCQDGKCTLIGEGGAGNTPEGGAGSGPGPGDAGAANEPGAGGAGETGGSNGSGSGASGKAGNGAANETGNPDDPRGVYGLVTGGGGCSCRTAPLEGGKWAFALSLLVLGSIVHRRRSGAKRRAA